MRIITPALNYADMLAVTLPAWRALLPDASIDVAIGREDILPSLDRGVASRVAWIRTDAWTVGGASLNKAAVLDELMNWYRIGEVLPADTRDDYWPSGDVCIVADADVVPFGKLPEAIEPDILYGCARYQCDTPEQLEEAKRGRGSFPLIQPRTRIPRAFTPAEAASMCVGYFQMFRYSPARTFGSFPTAGGYDAAFRRQFPRRVGLTDFHVLHLGESTRENWAGRVVRPWPAAVSA